VRDEIVRRALDRPDSYSAKKLMIDAQRYAQEAELMKKLRAGDYSTDAAGKRITWSLARTRFVNDFYEIQATIRGRTAQLQEEFPSDFENDRLDQKGDPLDTALQQYFDAIDAAISEAGLLDSVKFQRAIAALKVKWTPEQADYVDQYRASKEHPPAVWQIVNYDRGKQGSFTIQKAEQIWAQFKSQPERQDLLDLWAKRPGVRDGTQGAPVSATPSTR
jgi:hypothetical protein